MKFLIKNVIFLPFCGKKRKSKGDTYRQKKEKIYIWHTMIWGWTIFLIILGFLLLVRGADVFIDESAKIAKKLNISELVIGLTLVSLGTSLPELTVCVIAGISNTNEIAIGNIIGSNIANIALILGICGIIKKTKITSESLIKQDIPFMVFSGIIFLVLGFDVFFKKDPINFNGISFWDGIILLLLFCFFLYGIFKKSMSAQTQKNKIEGKKPENVLKLIFFTVGSLIAIVGGGKIIVDNAIILAQLLGASQTIIGLTVVAIGTSLPEMVTTIMAVIKNRDGVAIGNIVGSNILNILLILGISAVITPLSFPVWLVSDTIIMLTVSTFLFIYVFYKRSVDFLLGSILVASYIAYFVFIYLRETAA